MNRKGFTLVEIMAIIVILALLAIAAGAGVNGVLQKQRQKLAYTAEQNVHDASISYYSKNAAYLKSCTDSTGANIVISQKDIEDLNNFLRDKFKDFSGESLYQLYKNYSINGNDNPTNKYELDPYIKVSNRSCYKLITVGELIEQGLISDSDGMCNKASMIIIYRKADAKNTAGIVESVQEPGVCKSDRKADSGPVVTISPPSDLSLSNSKKIKVTVTTESTKLKTSFTMKYGWSKDKMIKPSSYSDLKFSGNTEKNGSAEISVGTLNETRYLWIKAGTELDNKNNKTLEMISGPYAFLPTVFVTYDVNTGDTSSCPAKKTVVFSKTYGKNINNNDEELCEPTKTGYDFKGWYKDNAVKVENGTKVTQKTDHTLVAKWEPHIYTITLDKNAATNTPTSSIKVTYDTNKLDPTSITLPARIYKVKGFGLDAKRKSNGATRDSHNDLTSTYTFNGWTTRKNGSIFLLNNSATPLLQPDIKDGSTEYTITSGIWKRPADITSYAKWTSASVTLPGITKTGYTCGWTTSETGTTISYDIGTNYTPTEDTTMYGVCEPCNYKIVFHKNNNSATGSTTDKICTYDEDCTLTGNGYSLSGYTFNGWNTKSDKTGTNYANSATVKNLTSTCDGTVNLYAQWCQNCASVTNGTCSLNASTAGTCTYTTSCNTGYYISAGNGTRNPTCSARIYNITYELNGGSTPSSGVPSSYTYGVGATINGKSTKTGYNFAGWSTNSSGTSPSATKTISSSETGDKKYYAVFTSYSKKIKVTFIYQKGAQYISGNGGVARVERECTMNSPNTQCSVTAPALNNFEDDPPDEQGTRDKGSKYVTHCGGKAKDIFEVKGWTTSSTDSNDGKAGGSSISVSQDTTFYSHIDAISNYVNKTDKLKVYAYNCTGKSGLMHNFIRQKDAYGQIRKVNCDGTFNGSSAQVVSEGAFVQWSGDWILTTSHRDALYLIGTGTRCTCSPCPKHYARFIQLDIR